jgi:hypothetical protein
MRNLWCLEKNSILPFIISATGIIPQSLFKNLKILGLGNTLVVEIGFFHNTTYWYEHIKNKANAVPSYFTYPHRTHYSQFPVSMAENATQALAVRPSSGGNEKDPLRNDNRKLA